MEANKWFNISDTQDSDLAFSEFINRYVWRDRNGGELIVSFYDDEGWSRYKYYDFSKELFIELHDRRNNPSSYGEAFSKWFLREVTEQHEYKSLEDVKEETGKIE